MKLLKFRVLNFRSVDDSGWIEVDSVTSLIGTNESGKTNLLLALWKLNPAQDGEIKPTADYPRKRFNEIRSMSSKPVFISTYFELSNSLAEEISNLTGTTIDDVKITSVQKDFDGTYYIGFPDALQPLRYIDKSEVQKLLLDTKSKASTSTIDEIEEDFRQDLISRIDQALSILGTVKDDRIDQKKLEKIELIMSEYESENIRENSFIETLLTSAIESIDDMLKVIKRPHPQKNQEARTLVLNNLPVFVYYSNYGNLDSEIYLPHVIENLNRDNLGSREEAKARTLKVLFEFVNLDPTEILELGKDFPIQQGRPSEEQIQEIAEKKKQRDILLQSASTELTHKFRDWWKQGEYRFRFQADGDHFRIWVSDDKRPEEIELEGRSTGLQWFLSFYLIFLVESEDTHKDAILLLDEPGMTLHPIAQRDLSEFFANLSKTNQLVYTTHSPFLVSPDHLERVKSVYINENGLTFVSSDLRAGEKNSAQSQSIYPVHAALGLSVSDTLLQGCQPVVVEGASDQYYLSSIKNYLIGKGLIKPKREIIFIPAGGVKGISLIAPIIMGKDDNLPYVILDSDSSGQGMEKQLNSNLYNGASDKIIMIGKILNIENAEVEDLFPREFLAKIITKTYLNRAIDDFDDVVVEDTPIIPQVEQFAKKNNINLEKGWKVEIAKKAKTSLVSGKDPLDKNQHILECWKEIFSKIENEV
ncbi:MAG TPA: AAA family ATPase [Nostocaceae cyanobacterium]|nr:AAA family ATPase [Nostocaceae cyanobacterium]